MSAIEAQREPMPAATLEEQHVEQAGMLSRIRDMAVNAWETAVRHPKETLAVGVASLALAQAAELTVDAAPVEAKGSAGTGNLRSCTRLPKIVRATLSKPGQLEQQWFLKENFPDLSDETCGDIKRDVQIKTQLKRHGHWITTNNWDEVFFLETPEQSRKGGPAVQVIGTGHDMKAKCGDKAGFKVRVQAEDTATHKIVAQRVGGPYRVKILPGLCN